MFTNYQNICKYY